MIYGRQMTEATPGLKSHEKLRLGILAEMKNCSVTWVVASHFVIFLPGLSV